MVALCVRILLLAVYAICVASVPACLSLIYVLWGQVRATRRGVFARQLLHLTVADLLVTTWVLGFELKWRPKIAVRKLTEGSSNLEGIGSEDFFQRSYIDGRTLITWEAEKICTIGTLFDLRNYPVDVQALDILLELKTPVNETKVLPTPCQD